MITGLIVVVPRMAPLIVQKIALPGFDEDQSNEGCMFQPILAFHLRIRNVKHYVK